MNINIFRPYSGRLFYKIVLIDIRLLYDYLYLNIICFDSELMYN